MNRLIIILVLVGLAKVVSAEQTAFKVDTSDITPNTRYAKTKANAQAIRAENLKDIESKRKWRRHQQVLKLFDSMIHK